MFIAITVGLFFACNNCLSNREGAITRSLPDISDFSVVFINGNATLHWVDSPDYYLDHIEISWEPDGGEPVSIDGGVEEYTVPGLKEDTVYTFTVTAVDSWKNKSAVATSGSGAVLKQRAGSIKGIPAAEQITLSWTEPAGLECDHIEITINQSNEYSDYETPVRIHRGVERKTFANLVNGLEYTFYIEAVDDQGGRTLLNNTGIFISDHAASPESVEGRSSAGQITLVWEDPFNPRFEYIEIVYSPDGETPLIAAKGEQTRTITGFSDLVDHEFTVYAVDNGGRRMPLTGVNVLSPEIPLFSGRDAAMTVARGIPVTGQIILEWADPAMEDLDHIAIIYYPDGRDEPVVVDRETETVILTGLSDKKEYLFLAYGVDSKNNNRVIAGLKLSTPELPVLRTNPVGGRVTLNWIDPEDPKLGRIELSYSPNGETPVRIAKGVETYTFSGLFDNEEYEFKVTAISTEGNVYAAAVVNIIVARLPVLTGMPINRRLSLAWTDPADINFEHIEIAYSPSNGRPQGIARGIENHTFTNLLNDIEYTFTIYARDSIGNRHPVRAAKFYDPQTAFIIYPETALHAETDKLASLNWKPANNTTFGNSTIYALAYGITANGTARWVAGGAEGRLAYSNDYGLNWIRVGDSPFGNYAVTSIGYGNGHWVAGGKNGKMAWSTNGAVWHTVRKPGSTSNTNINVVAFGGRRWIVGGSDGVIMLSDDNGVSWLMVAAGVFGRSEINTIVYHEGRWIAGGAAGKIAYSDDNGFTWTAVSNSTFGNSAVNVVIYDRERWLAGGYAQRVAYSEDGITWHSLARPFYILCLGFNGVRWVAGGQEGRMAWSSDGGDNWTVDDLGHNLFGTDWVQAVTFGGAPNGRRRWLSSGQNGKIIYADE